jgi:hypothetical protein
MNGSEQETILKRDALGWVVMSREQREALLDEFERSGLKGAQFARTAGICYPTFAAWVQRRRHERGDYQGRLNARAKPVTPSLRLIEAVAGGSDRHKPVDETGLEIELPGGARLVLRNAQQAPLVAQLLKAITTSC